MKTRFWSITGDKRFYSCSKSTQTKRNLTLKKIKFSRKARKHMKDMQRSRKTTLKRVAVVRRSKRKIRRMRRKARRK